jgi:hypothetical protein
MCGFSTVYSLSTTQLSPGASHVMWHIPAQCSNGGLCGGQAATQTPHSYQCLLECHNRWDTPAFACSLDSSMAMRYPNKLHGGGWVPVGSPVFKTGGGSYNGPRWVRLPSTPALLLEVNDEFRACNRANDRHPQSYRSTSTCCEAGHVHPGYYCRRTKRGLCGTL